MQADHQGGARARRARRLESQEHREVREAEPHRGRGAGGRSAPGAATVRQAGRRAWPGHAGRPTVSGRPTDRSIWPRNTTRSRPTISRSRRP
ncbi:unnamed protein product, partial [Trichogramma brassicae]